ncbi:acyl-CoA dehydrogenase family protein [Cupriavidus taiwanensis]|uniref:Isovaleryl-CoA dehydrogenase n=1 Tax=Cupriavidus taiwanensis TaxID=164546 RepID=A0A7Z7J6N1_9BURK|nr:acyl-CoA dehydrogenase family protein [Cupriavidus taiwanensis]SOY89662.1 Isovaleryl-CoA dehydrogenase [Cupriavidus taiwanensis]SOZ03444.1 Isovaleryl-CoA dehydrogenase [Cupriavidus taiwanensis]SOZ09022.1 Isovaleryl-CoA dehydrogenase [Cupriavidus taiwanensis]SPC07233.1 Isovaleryl-CoA dehydrogenase [Cupriavidus taiwanensis]SPD41953.1 Acyl-CoA dehydrogenase [Cupriavidus taiwanensis]
MTTSLSQFELSPEQREIYEQAFRFARAELAPLLPRMDDEDWYPETLMPMLGAAGYLGITAPPEYGGSGMDLFSAGMVGEAFGYWNANAGFIWGPHENLCLNNILRNGTDEQKRRYLPKLCSGEWVGALALTEPGAGSDALGSMRTAARRDGDHYVLNGRKMFISNGPVADVVLVYAKTEPTLGAKGISAFIVEKGFPGFSVAQKLNKMGWRGAPTGELVFDECRVPARNLVGGENRGVAVVMSGLDIERAFLALSCIGSAQRCLDLSLEYASTRQQFGKPIASFQLVQAMLADMFVELEAARALAYRALMACNDLERGGGGRGDIHKLCAASILKVAEMLLSVTDKAVQIHGGSGFIWETEVNRHYRNAKLATIGGGTSEVRRLIIAEELLRATH